MQLTKQQQEAVNELDANLQLIACAGAGKTSVITKRIVNILKTGKARNSQIVAFTFTNKAAESLKDRIRDEAAANGIQDTEGMFIGTIHKFCKELLTRYCDDFAETVLLNTVQSHLFIQRFSKYCGLEKTGLKTNIYDIRLFTDCISKMAENASDMGRWEKEKRDAFDDYRNCLRSHKFIDFTSLILRAIEEIKGNDNVQKYIRSVRYLIVDEYQDVDDLQEELISLFAAAGSNICVVGDDDQTIYQFRGSNAENMIGFSKRYRNVKTLRLDYNFRSGKGVIDLADKVITINRNRLPKEMKCAEINSGMRCDIRAIRSDESQYKSIARKVEEIHQNGLPYSEIAVLCRKGKFIDPVCYELESRGIPCATNNADSFFSSVYFNKFLFTLGMIGNERGLDKGSLYSCWENYISREDFGDAFKKLRRCTRGGSNTFLPLGKVLETFLEDVHFLEETASDYDLRVASFNGIQIILEDFDQIYGDYNITARADRTVKFLKTCGEEEYGNQSFIEKDTADSVQVLTVHKAKGLEFDTVIIPDMEQGNFPVGKMGGRSVWSILGNSFSSVREKYDSDIEDERKLFYVAVTRAKKNIYFYYDLTKKNISQFLREASKSDFLKIDKLDFADKELKVHSFNPGNTQDQQNYYEKQHLEYEARQQYWSRVKAAKAALRDYYGTAAHAIRGAAKMGAYGDLMNVYNMSPNEALQEAARLGLNF